MFKVIKFLGKAVAWLIGAVVGLVVLAVAVVAVRYLLWTPDPVASFYGENKLVAMGHRGSPEAAPENTISSFRTAMQAGADGVELDVMLSKDGAIVVIHDYVLDTTTDGSGPVKDYTLEQLKDFNAGYWFSEEFAGERIPTLEEVIAALPAGALINIEIKSESPATDGLEEAVVAAVREHDLYDRVIVSSFNPISLLRVKLADERIPVGLIYAPDLARYLSDGWFIPLLRPEALHPSYQMVDEEYMRWARKKGFRVNVWTVNEAADIRRMIELGVDGIITDRPELLRQIMEEQSF